ncbi:MAG: cation:proton antiporter [Vicinamibacterales bacterium]
MWQDCTGIAPCHAVHRCAATRLSRASRSGTHWLRRATLLHVARSGLRTSVHLISGATLWGHAALILLVAVVGKGVGSALATRVQGTPWIEASAIGILLNTRGLVELVVLNIGLDLGILSPVLFSMMVLMALATTLATAPLLSLLRSRTSALENGT